MLIAHSTGPSDCILVPERDGELKSAADTNTVYYKEAENRQAKIELHRKRRMKMASKTCIAGKKGST